MGPVSKILYYSKAKQPQNPLRSFGGILQMEFKTTQKGVVTVYCERQVVAGTFKAIKD